MSITTFKTFIINLETKINEYTNLSDSLKSLGFNDLERWNATVGRNLTPIIFNPNTTLKDDEVFVTLQAYTDLVKGRNLHRALSSKGALGCYMSHVNIWKWLLNQPSIDRVVVFEDDAYLSDNAVDKIDTCLQSIPFESIDFFSFGYNNTSKGFTEEVNDFVSLYRGEFWGLQGYMITKKGATKLLENIFPIDVQIDSYIGLFAEYNPDFNLYITNKKYVKQNYHISSIQDKCVKCRVFEYYDIIMKYKYLILFIIILIIIKYKK
jgi:GR25 family glycosyltransferase involved in LPS biosynthesis